MSISITTQQVEELAVYLNSLRDQHLDFPTIWLNHLKRHPLVIGIPIQVSLSEIPKLKIPLLRGRSLHFSEGRFKPG